MRSTAEPRCKKFCTYSKSTSMDTDADYAAFSQNTLSSSSPSSPVYHSVGEEAILHQVQMLCSVAVPPTGGTYSPKVTLQESRSTHHIQRAWVHGRPEFSIIRLKNNSIYLKPDESFVYIGRRVSIS